MLCSFRFILIFLLVRWGDDVPPMKADRSIGPRTENRVLEIPHFRGEGVVGLPHFEPNSHEGEIAMTGVFDLLEDMISGLVDVQPEAFHGAGL